MAFPALLVAFPALDTDLRGKWGGESMALKGISETVWYGGPIFKERKRKLKCKMP